MFLEIEPWPITGVVRVYTVWVKVAVTALLPVMVTVVGLVVPIASPLQ